MLFLNGLTGIMILVLTQLVILACLHEHARTAAQLSIMPSEPIELSTETEQKENSISATPTQFDSVISTDLSAVRHSVAYDPSSQHGDSYALSSQRWDSSDNINEDSNTKASQKGNMQRAATDGESVSEGKDARPSQHQETEQSSRSEHSRTEQGAQPLVPRQTRDLSTEASILLSNETSSSPTDTVSPPLKSTGDHSSPSSLASLGSPQNTTEHSSEAHPSTPQENKNNEGVNARPPQALEGHLEGVYWGTDRIERKNWVVSVPTGYGIIIEFESLSIGKGHTLNLLGLRKGVPYRLKSYNEALYSDLAPVLSKEYSLWIEFYAPAPTSALKSFFSMSYTAHPKADIPAYTKNQNWKMESEVMYFCEGISNLPAAISCDGIRHCEQGEDEENCTYHHQGCGGWLPYGSNCIKATFIRTEKVRFTSNTHSDTIPYRAEEYCRSHYSATLASLQEAGGMQLASSMVRKSGFLNAVVGIRKVKPVDRRMKHLYRFVWQWGEKGSPIAYDQNTLQKSGTALDCAQLSVEGDPILEPLQCALPKAIPDGFLCMRPNPTRAEGRLSLPGISFPRASDTPTQLSLPGISFPRASDTPTQLSLPGISFPRASDTPTQLSLPGISFPRASDTPTQLQTRLSLPGISFPRASDTPTQLQTKECPDGSLVQTFHRCRWGQEDDGNDDDDDDTGWSPLGLPLFHCRFGRAVHYSLLCDGKDDCPDGSDEVYCRQPRYAPLLRSSFVCSNLQAVPRSKRCDGMHDCFDDSDEDSCSSCWGITVMCPDVGCIPARYAGSFKQCAQLAMGTYQDSVPSFPAKVNMDGTGMFTLEDLKDDCGEGFFQCQGGHCIPTYLLNNGEQDCPRGEDEGTAAHNVTCPGYYRCQGSGICVHKDRVCDRLIHCPNKDDETFCHVTCPRERGCRCEGWAYTCSRMIDPVQHLHLRYLDLSRASDVTLDTVHLMEYLFFLNLSACGLSNVSLLAMHHLRVLDLSSNSLSDLLSFSLRQLPALEHLDLSHNPFLATVGKDFATAMELGPFHNMKTLLMTNVSTEVIEGRAFSPLTRLRYLDLRKNPLKQYSKDSLVGLKNLEELHTDESKLCCGYFHPSVARCYAPVDELSSCSDLLGQDLFRAFLWTVSSQAMAGNLGVLVYRLFIATRSAASASGVLVKNLCLADLLMGLYMALIGLADARFRGDYVAHHHAWKSSLTCTVAGVLSFLSSEVSAFVVCLITLDRVLVLCWPFASHLHLSRRLTLALCCALWGLGGLLAALPLLAGMEFYGQNGICLPLPITRHRFSGQTYAFAVFIVLNFVLFLFIGAGQAVIYCAVRRAGRAVGGCQTRERDTALARRLLVVVLSDFCCWFPIGLLGLLAFHGVPVPGVVNVWAAIFVLPLNSALNPFLYTLNGVLQRRQARRMERRTKKTLGRLRTEIGKWQPASVQELVKICLTSKLLDRDTLDRAKLLGLREDTPGVRTTAEEDGQGSESGHYKGQAGDTHYEPQNGVETANIPECVDIGEK